MRTSTLAIVDLELGQPDIIHRPLAARSAKQRECGAVAPLTEVRVQLETFALIKLAETGLRDVRELESQARQIAGAVEAGDVMRYLAADRAFHLELLTRAGNDVLTGIVMRLRDTMRLYGIRSQAGLARQRASVPEHYKIIEALGRQGRRDLTALMREHILSWESVFTEAIRNCRPSPGPLATPPGLSARP